MALNIPNVGLPGESFLKGVDTGSSMFTRMIQPVLEREKQRQQAQQFAQELALKKQQLARMGANTDLQRKILEQNLIKLQHSNDPAYEFNQFKNLMGVLSGVGAPNQLPTLPTEEVGQGMGLFTPEGLKESEKTNVELPSSKSGMNFDVLKQNPLLRGYFKHKFGFDPLAPTEEQKRQADQQAKIELENIKTENKAKALKDKELVAVNKDLPTLEKSLKGVDELLRIARENPSMFGHGFMPERFAKTTHIKDFGKWQNLISDAIAGLEQKLSARGNLVALKMAAQLKPSHAEQQEVAIGKLESMKGQLVDSINRSRDLLGLEKLPMQNYKYKDDDMVIVEGPNGEQTMTYAQAKALGAQ